MNEKLQVYNTKMEKSQHSLEAELATIRAGRANPNVLNKLSVDYYGIPTPIQQVANISVPEARMIQIQPWEKSLIKETSYIVCESDRFDILSEENSDRFETIKTMKHGIAHISVLKMRK